MANWVIDTMEMKGLFHPGGDHGFWNGGEALYGLERY